MLGSRGMLEDSSFSPWDRRAYSKDSPNWNVNETGSDTFQAKLKTEQQQRSDLVLTRQGQRIWGQIFEDPDQLTERQAANHVSEGRVEHRKGLKRVDKTCYNLENWQLFRRRREKRLPYLLSISAHQRGQVGRHNPQHLKCSIVFE